jgi:Zn-finger nucleic acid-binding protein
VSYREHALPCPGCGGVLAPETVGEAVIDVCPACGGIWVDWFDGDLDEMVRGAPTAAAGRGEGAGKGECPRCSLPLADERYLEGRTEIQRCGECAGAFVPRDAAKAIVEGGSAPPAPDALSRLAAVLQRWFGWDDKASG